MKKKLWFTYIGVAFIVLLFSWTAFSLKGRSYMDSQNRRIYMTQAKLLRETFEESKISAKDFARKYGANYEVRITIIDREGKVVADSAIGDVAAIDNQDSRPEVRNALEGREDIQTRYSDTMREQYFYAAVPLARKDINGVLRVALPTSKLMGIDNELIQGLLAAILIALGAAFIAAYLFSCYVTRPIDDVMKGAEDIASGNYGGMIYTRQLNQIGRIADAFNYMSLTLRRSAEGIKNRDNELDAVLESMTGAVVAIDDLNKILFYNRPFLELLEALKDDLTGHNLFDCVRCVPMFDVIDQVRKQSETCSKEGTFHVSEEKVIHVAGTPLYKEHNKTYGVLLVIEDRTELRSLEAKVNRD